MSVAVLNDHFYFKTESPSIKTNHKKFCLHGQLVAAMLLGEATFVGYKVYSVTSDPDTQREGLEEEKRKWE